MLLVSVLWTVGTVADFVDQLLVLGISILGTAMLTNPFDLLDFCATSYVAACCSLASGGKGMESMISTI